MSKYGVIVPIAGYIYIVVEAESEEEAYTNAVTEWRDEHIMEFNAYRRLVDEDGDLIPSPAEAQVMPF